MEPSVTWLQSFRPWYMYNKYLCKRPSGIRTQVGVKVFGNDLATIEQKETEIERALRTVPGVADRYSERITGAPYLEIKVNREAAARYGIKVGDVQDVIETAIGGKNLTTAIDCRQRLPVRVRYAPDFRQGHEELRNNVSVRHKLRYAVSASPCCRNKLSPSGKKQAQAQPEQTNSSHTPGQHCGWADRRLRGYKISALACRIY
jgi:multidrug efflux pump subunit AcrB